MGGRGHFICLAMGSKTETVKGQELCWVPPGRCKIWGIFDWREVRAELLERELAKGTKQLQCSCPPLVAVGGDRDGDWVE